MKMPGNMGAMMQQDLVMAACNEAVKKVEAETQQKMSGMLGGLGLPPGMV
jgi:nucleoid-associated protein EbfC